MPGNYIGAAVGNPTPPSTPVVWAPSTSYILNACVYPRTPNGLYYKCTTAGTSGLTGAEPTWPTIIGTTVSDNTAVWVCNGDLPLLGVSPQIQLPLSGESETIASIAVSIQALADFIAFDQANGAVNTPLINTRAIEVDPVAGAPSFVTGATVALGHKQLIDTVKIIGGNTVVFHYYTSQTAGYGYEITVNGVWNDGSQLWTCNASGADALRLRMILNAGAGVTQFSFDYHSATASTWADTAWTSWGVFAATGGSVSNLLDVQLSRGLIASKLNIPAGATLPVLPTVTVGGNGGTPTIDANSAESAGVVSITGMNATWPAGATAVLNVVMASGRQPMAVQIEPIDVATGVILSNGVASTGLYVVRNANGFTIQFENVSGGSVSPGTTSAKWSYICVY